MIQLGCCMGAAITDQDREKLVLLKQIGYDYVEYGLRDLVALSEEMRQQALENIKQVGLECYAMNLFLPNELIAVGPDSDLGAIKQYLDRAFPIVKAFGAKRIVFGSGGARTLPSGCSKQGAELQLVGLLRLVESYCEQIGVILAMEPLSRVECNLINTVMEGYWLVQQANRPHVKLLADYYHVQRNSEQLEDVTSAGKYLCHAHTANQKGRSFPSWQTVEEQRQFFAALKEAEYSGGVSVEGQCSDFAKDAKEAFEVLDQLRR